MQAVDCLWNHDGSILAVCGIRAGAGIERESNIVMFYTPMGEVWYYEYKTVIARLYVFVSALANLENSRQRNNSSVLGGKVSSYCLSCGQFHLFRQYSS